MGIGAQRQMLCSMSGTKEIQNHSLRRHRLALNACLTVPPCRSGMKSGEPHYGGSRALVCGAGGSGDLEEGVEEQKQIQEFHV